MTKRRWTLCALTLALVLTLMPGVCYAAETEGTCGENLTWSLSGGVLTVSGSGEMTDAPWAEYKNEVHTLELTGGVTSIAAEAFSGFTNLTSVDFGSDLKEIGTRAFYGCTALTELSVPSSFRRFGEESFRDCKALTDIYCYGKMPSFNLNCLWTGKPITVHCMGTAWSEGAVQQLETNFHGRMEILDKDGNDIWVYTEETLPPTGEETLPVTEEPTEAPTEEPTQPETLAPTGETSAPDTQPGTVPETHTQTEPVQTDAPEAPTVPSVQKTGGLSVKTWLLIALGALLLLALAALFVAVKSAGRGKYSR